MKSPVSEYRWKVNDSGTAKYLNRLLIGTAVTGLVRVEWVQARYGQIIPVNWSFVEVMNYLDAYMPLRYQVADAQNLIVQAAVEGDYEWVLLLEHDVMLPPFGFLKFTDYMDWEAPIAPVVSGLYYTRSRPSEPLIFRGRGNGPYTHWKIGDKVYCDGVPTGALLIHAPILKLMHADAEAYNLRGKIIKRVFKHPNYALHDPELNMWNTLTGTSDLQWCTDVMEGDYMKKAGWGDFAKAHKRYPFLVDTEIFCKHIDPDGTQFP